MSGRDAHGLPTSARRGSARPAKGSTGTGWPRCAALLHLPAQPNQPGCLSLSALVASRISNRRWGLAEVHHLTEQRREFITDGERSELRATWHNDAGYVVISLWRGDTCVATSHLTPKEAGRLATFITGGLADLAQWGTLPAAPVSSIAPRVVWQDRLRRGSRSWRVSVGWSLEQIARRLRS